MTKTERDELRRLLRSRFKVLRADVQARKAEMMTDLEARVEAEFVAADVAYDDAMVLVKLAVDEANRRVNDICRDLYGREQWGDKYDRVLVQSSTLPRPGVSERRERRLNGAAEIDKQVARALVELERRENELLTQLATSALESAEAQAFFNRIPSVSELVPAYRLAEIAAMGDQ